MDKHPTTQESNAYGIGMGRHVGIRSEQGSGGGGFAVLLMLIIAVAAYLILSTSATLTSVTLKEVESGKPVGLFMVIRNDELPEQIKKDHPQAVMAKYISLLGDNERIPATGWALLKATQAEVEARNCGNMVTAAPIFHAFQPKVGSMEAGEKVYVMTMGLTGVGEGGCEIGSFVPDPNYDPTFKPFAANGLNPLQIANCQLRLWAGMQYQNSSCMDSGFQPTANWIRQSPVPNADDSGLYIVFAYATGIWVNSIESSMLPTTFSYFQVNPDTQQAIQQFMQQGLP